MADMKRAFIEVDVVRIPADRAAFQDFCRRQGYRITGDYHAFAKCDTHYIRIHAGNYLVYWDGELIKEAAEDDIIKPATLNPSKTFSV